VDRNTHGLRAAGAHHKPAILRVMVVRTAKQGRAIVSLPLGWAPGESIGLIIGLSVAMNDVHGYTLI
jgi:hypothetical protein